MLESAILCAASCKSSNRKLVQVLLLLLLAPVLGGHLYLATMDATNANCSSNQAAKFGADDRELRREEWQPAVEEALRVLEGRVEAQAAGAHPHASHDDDAGGAA